MLASSSPPKWQFAFASGNSGLLTAPLPTTTGAGTGRASQALGWQSINAIAIAAGGIAPFVQDMNGALNMCSSWDQWYAAGGAVYYDSTFSGNIGGYPSGAVLGAASLLGGSWLSTTDNNTSDPDTGGSNWTFVRPASWGAIQTGAGTANAITVALSPVPLSLASLVGQTLKFTVAQANTGAATINPNILGALTLARSDGTALSSGDLATSIVYQGIVISTSVVQLVAAVPSQIAVSAPLNICTDTSGTPNAIVASPSPAITYTNGVTVRVHPANANTGPATANISTLGSIAITRPDGSACAPNDILTTKYFDAVIKVAAGPVTTLQMLSWPQNASGGSNSITGASHTYAITDAGTMILRSNSGSPMLDTMPGNSTTPLPANWAATIVNADATALLVLAIGNTGAGSTLSGSGVVVGTVAGAYHLYLGPGQSARLTADGTNYQVWGAPGRAKCTANPTFFVSNGGTDGSSGLTSGDPLKTGTHAYEVMKGFIDLAGFQPTIQLAGTGYNATISCNGPLFGQAGPCIINGAGSGTTTVNVAGACIGVTNGAKVQPQNMTLTASGAASGCFSVGGSSSSPGCQLFMGPGLVTGACVLAKFNVVGAGNQVILSSSYTDTGNSTWHWLAEGGGVINNGNTAITITESGTPAYSSAYAGASDGALINPANDITFSGSATGSRYSVTANATINTSGSGANYFPGNAPGTGTNYF